MNDNSLFLAQFFSTPPITRALSVSIIAVIICVYIKLVSPYSLMYSPYFLKTGELWRIFTCFLYFGNPSLDVLIHITFLYRYSRMLEEGFIYTSDYFWLVFIISSLLFFIANIFSIPLLASAFSSTITYIWARKNPHAIVQIFGFISFPAFYLPFIIPLFMLVTEKKIMTEDLLGIVVGHLYFFFKDVYPKWGLDIFRTPCIIKKLFGEHSDECCKKPKYRTLNLNTTQPNPTMETIILEGSMNLEETIIEDEPVKKDFGSHKITRENAADADISHNMSIESLSDHQVRTNQEVPMLVPTDQELINHNIFDQDDTNKVRTDQELPNSSSTNLENNNLKTINLGDHQNNPIKDENSFSYNSSDIELIHDKEENNNYDAKEKDWEEKWSSETVEDSSS